MNSIYAEDNNAFAFFQVGDDDDSDQAGSSVCVQRDKIQIHYDGRVNKIFCLTDLSCEIEVKDDYVSPGLRNCTNRVAVY